ncbi:hypothetical protein HYX12_01455 [Candidatus Woesearchaeota archaeon]|nr:hypothetical protein [Candidatus Woesearchaeota archaeon]
MSIVNFSLIKLNPDYGQHFLVDETILEFIVKTAEISSEDIILEIGPGIGNLTRKLTGAKKVIAVEVDKQFSSYLSSMPNNVEIIWQDGLDFLRKNSLHKHSKLRNNAHQWNKLIANIPYQLGEPLLHELCLLNQWTLTVLTVPKHFAEKMQKHPIFSAFLNMNVLKEVPRELFQPKPRVDSVVLKIERQKELLELELKGIEKEGKSDKVSAFVRRYLYNHQEKKLKNVLEDLLIELNFFKSDERLSKKEAKKRYLSFRFKEELLNKKVKGLLLKDYEIIAEKAVKVLNEK